MGRGAVLLFALLLMATAGAQVPPQPEPSGVAISPESVQMRLSVEGPETEGFTVEHTGGFSGPLDAFAQERDFRITLEGVPEGWTASVVPTDVRLPPGGTAEVQVQVAVSTGAEQRSADLQVRAQLVPQDAQGIPEAGPIVDPDAEATATLEALRDDPWTREGIETLGTWVYVILLAFLLVLALVGKLLVDRRRATLALHCDHRRVVLPPGGRGSFRLLVENLGREDITVVFHLGAVDDGWMAWLPVTELAVHSDHVEELQLLVTAPKNAREGERQEILVTAATATQRDRPARITLEAVVGPEG